MLITLFFVCCGLFSFDSLLDLPIFIKPSFTVDSEELMFYSIITEAKARALSSLFIKGRQNNLLVKNDSIQKLVTKINEECPTDTSKLCCITTSYINLLEDIIILDELEFAIKENQMAIFKYFNIIRKNVCVLMPVDLVFLFLHTHIYILFILFSFVKKCRLNYDNFVY